MATPSQRMFLEQGVTKKISAKQNIEEMMQVLVANLENRSGDKSFQWDLKSYDKPDPDWEKGSADLAKHFEKLAEWFDMLGFKINRLLKEEKERAEKEVDEEDSEEVEGEFYQLLQKKPLLTKIHQLSQEVEKIWEDYEAQLAPGGDPTQFFKKLENYELCKLQPGLQGLYPEEAFGAGDPFREVDVAKVQNKELETRFGFTETRYWLYRTVYRHKGPLLQLQGEDEKVPKVHISDELRKELKQQMMMLEDNWRDALPTPSRQKLLRSGRP